MEKILYDDKLKVNIPDKFIEVPWNEIPKLYGDTPVDYIFFNEEINSNITFLLRQESSIEAKDVVKRMSLLKTGYAHANIPGYHENECVSKDFQNHSLGLLTFTTTQDDNTSFYLIGLTNFNGKELIINFNCQMKNMPLMLSKIVKMIEEMEF